MPISQNLINEFAKLVNSSQKSEETASGNVYYGTIDDTGEFVKLGGVDSSGNEILTPISKTVEVNPGDKVTVILQDHQAIVTGNIAAPAINEQIAGDISTQTTTIMLEAHTVESDEKYVDTTSYIYKMAEIDQKIIDVDDQRARDSEVAQASISILQATTDSLNENITQNMEFSDTEGIILGGVSSPIKLQIKNDVINFKNGDTIMGFWNSNYFYTGNIIIRASERAQFGNFAFVPRSDGSLMFVKVGNDVE